MKSKDKNWLIKSSTRILGPYSLGEIIEMLRSKQISIIDEVRLPSGRWSYIRENGVFMEVVRNIRDEQDSYSEETMTQSLAHHTMTKTDPLPHSEDFTRTPVMNSWDKTPNPLNDVVPNLKDVTPPAEGILPRPGMATNGKTKSYGATADSRVQNKIRQKSNLLSWGLLATACVMAVLVVFIWNQKDKRKAVGFEELIAQAIRYRNLGLYEKSLQSYSKATKLREPDLNVQIQMAPLLISEDRQSLLGRRILERALSQEGRGRTEIVEAYLGIAVSYMMDGDLKQAEDILQKAIGYEPFNMSALLNMAIIKQKKGSYHEAMRDFEQIYNKNNQATLAMFGRSLSTVEYAKSHPDSQTLQILLRDIQANAPKTAYLRQEMYLLMVYAHSLMGDVNGLNQAVVKFLSQPQGQTKNYIHPLNIDWRITQWDYLERICTEIYQKGNPHPELKALRAVCLMEVNRDAEAGKLLQEAVAEAPRDPYVLSTQASYLVKIGRHPEAMSILKMPELKTLAVKQFLMGEICMKAQDVACAKSAYSEAYGMDNKSAMALFGLAWSVMHNQDNRTAYEYVRNGLQFEPNFLPLLELRDQLESQ